MKVLMDNENSTPALFKLEAVLTQHPQTLHGCEIRQD
jgi:hypothetical protein